MKQIDGKIIAVLKYPPLEITLRNHGNFEVRKLPWKDSASKCVRIYKDNLVMVCGLPKTLLFFIKEFFEQMVDEFNMK